jgi:hypothetical protein
MAGTPHNRERCTMDGNFRTILHWHSKSLAAGLWCGVGECTDSDKVHETIDPSFMLSLQLAQLSSCNLNMKIPSMGS